MAYNITRAKDKRKYCSDEMANQNQFWLANLIGHYKI